MLKALATEEYEKRETNLFGWGFLENASKRQEAEKAMKKVSGQSNKSGLPHKRARYENDKSDLRSFLVRGTSATYGGRRPQPRQPYSSFTRFQNRKYIMGQSVKAQTQPVPSTKSKGSQ